MTNNILTKAADLHVHLHGCLTFEDVLVLRPAALEKNQDEWRQLYEVKEKLSFAQFQRKFNLLIDLFPISPESSEVMDWVLRKQTCDYAEYRCFLPERFNDQQIGIYLNTLTDAFGKFSGAKIVLSGSRNPTQLVRQYETIKNWLKAHPAEQDLIVGLDLCGYEEDDVLHDKREIFARILDDNKRDPESALAILVHVGETFTSCSLPVSIARIAQAASLGAHRLGHATALGIDANFLKGSLVPDKPEHRMFFDRWLADNRLQLADFGFPVSAFLEPIPGVYDQAFIEQITLLQNAVMAKLSAEKAVIECCPTSNFYMSPMPTLKDHPMKRFLSHGLQVCLGSDDPGMFLTSIENEYKLAMTILGDSTLALRMTGARHPEEGARHPEAKPKDLPDLHPSSTQGGW